MAYLTTSCIIKPDNDIYGYFDQLSRKSKLLYNAALFRIRNIFTGYDKEHRTENEKAVFDEVNLLCQKYPSIKVRRVISYYHLEKMLKVTDNSDYRHRGLPTHVAQHVVKQAVADFNNWFAALKGFKKHPENYTGKPCMPHYKKGELTTFETTNQEAVLYSNGYKTELKMPLTKKRISFSNLPNDGILKTVKVKPFYGMFKLLLIFEVPENNISCKDMPNICSIDFGVDNFATIVCNDGSAAIYKGNAVLSECQWFHKQKAKYVSILTTGKEYSRYAPTKTLKKLSYHHSNFINDQCHKISRNIVNYCISHNAGTLVLGVNKFWKQNSSMGKHSNQNFISMPITILRKMITYKAERVGIKVIEQEESYTSKADIVAQDYIPVYGKDDYNASFSGKRIKRGLYKCSNKLIINADCNGAANIMRKAIPDAWKGITDFAFLADPTVCGYKKVNS